MLSQVRERRRNVYADIYRAHYFEALKMDSACLGVVIIAHRYRTDNGGTMSRRPDYTLEQARDTAAWLTHRASGYK